MSPAQFAAAAGASPKWISNTRRILRLSASMDATEARWFALIYDVHHSLECSLSRAAEIADVVVATSLEQRDIHIPVGRESGIELVIDLWRQYSVHLARLSLALNRPPNEQRGRPRATPLRRQRAYTRAVAYGVDVTRLREGMRRSVHERLVRLDENAAFLAAGRASLRRGRGPE